VFAIARPASCSPTPPPACSTSPTGRWGWSPPSSTTSSTSRWGCPPARLIVVSASRARSSGSGSSGSCAASAGARPARPSRSPSPSPSCSSASPSTLFPEQPGEHATSPSSSATTLVEIFGASVRWDERLSSWWRVVVAVGLRYLLKVTRTGVAMRAVVDNPDLAALTGANPVTIARVQLGARLGARRGRRRALSPTAGRSTPSTSPSSCWPPTAPRSFGRLRSLPLTFAGAIVLGLIQGYAPIAFPRPTELWNHLQVGVPGIFLFLLCPPLPPRGQAQRGPGGRSRRTPCPGLIESLIGAAAFVPARPRGRLPGRRLPPRPHAAPSSTPPCCSRSCPHGLLGADLPRPVRLLRPRCLRHGQDVAGGDSILGMGAAAAIAVPVGIIDRPARAAPPGPLPRPVTFAMAGVAAT
jgi:hypothetical protein